MQWLPLLALALIVSGCGPRVALKDLDVTQRWKLVELPPAPFKLSPEIHVLVWHNYLAPEIVQHFEAVYGVKVKLELFSENEELHEKLIRPGATYDLVMPGTYMVQQLVREKRLRQLKRANIPNLPLVDAAYFAMKHDPGLAYSVPYYQMSIGIALNVKYSWGLPLTWPELADETGHQLARGRLAVVDEMRSTLGTALLMLGLSPNTRKPEEIARARDLLLSTKAQTGVQFELNEMPERLIAEDFILATAWTGDAARALAKNGYVRFIVPRGKSLSELDSFAVPTTARHPDTAEFFINYLLVPEIAAALTNYSYYGNTSSASRGFVTPEIVNGPAFMEPMSDSALFLEDVEDAAGYYREAWKAVKDAPNPDIQKVPLPTPRVRSASKQ